MSYCNIQKISGMNTEHSQKQPLAAARSGQRHIRVQPPAPPHSCEDMCKEQACRMHVWDLTLPMADQHRVLLLYGLMLKWVWRKKTDEQRKAAEEVPRRRRAMAPHQEFKCSLACKTYAEQSGILGFASSHPSQVMHTQSKKQRRAEVVFGKRQKLSVKAVTQRFNGQCSGEWFTSPEKG